jgi:transcriptional regulator of acetoin/glycerol metabolism
MGSLTPSDLLTPEIRQSWERCLEAGLDPHRPPEPVHAAAAAVREARERHELTRRLALAEMHNLYYQISLLPDFRLQLHDSAGRS